MRLCVVMQGSQLRTGSAPFYSAVLGPIHTGLQKLAAKLSGDFGGFGC